MFLSFAAGLFAIRDLKILAEGDVERYQVVRALSLITMTIAPYFIPDPWNNAAVIGGLLGLVVSFFLKPKDYDAHDVEVSGLYWHFVDLVWMFIFPLVYLMSTKIS